MTGSVAILADAIHDFGDTVALGFALWLEKKSIKKRDAFHSYGYKRYSIFAQAISALLILMGSVFIIGECIERLYSLPEAPVGWGMLALASLGVLVNGFAALKLGAFLKPTHCHGHHHGHSHSHSHSGHSHAQSGSERLFSLHLLEDALGWVLVLVGAIGIFFTGWKWIDPVLGLALSAFVIFNVVRHSKIVFDVLLQKTPPQFDVKVFHDKSRQIPNLKGIHDLHVWTLDGDKHVLSMHAVVKQGLSSLEIQEVKKSLQGIVTPWGDFHMTIETEFQNEDCRESCDDEHEGPNGDSPR